MNNKPTSPSLEDAIGYRDNQRLLDHLAHAIAAAITVELPELCRETGPKKINRVPSNHLRRLVTNYETVQRKIQAFEAQLTSPTKTPA
jgi:hypothetical protein